MRFSLIGILSLSTILLACQHEKANSKAKKESKTITKAEPIVKALKEDSVTIAAAELVTTQGKVNHDSSLFTQKNYGIGKIVPKYEEKMYADKTYSLKFYESCGDSLPSHQVEYNWINEGGGYVKSTDDEFIKMSDYHIDEPPFCDSF